MHQNKDWESIALHILYALLFGAWLVAFLVVVTGYNAWVKGKEETQDEPPVMICTQRIGFDDLYHCTPKQ